MMRALISDRNAARWVLPLALIGLGASALISIRSRGIDGTIFVAVGIALLVCEVLFVLPWSARPKRCCPRCNCLSDLGATSCVFCGREWVHDRGMVYDAGPEAVPATARQASWAMFASVGCAIIGAVVGLVVLQNVISVGVIAFCLAAQLRRVFRTIATRSTVQTLQRHDGANCIHCLYPLGRTMQRCPECGEPGDLTTARWTWARAGLWMPTRQTSAIMKQDHEGRERTLREGPATGARGSL
ncbi:MAG: hypothetical protein K2Y21_09190 [Phycisphaerales bacterium]|nr:hypothetical protein [Phycisphaerales bacterium]